MFTIHLVLFAFLFKTSNLKTILGETSVYKLNETNNSYNGTSTFTDSENLDVTTELATIQVITEKSWRNNDNFKAKKSQGSEISESDISYDDYSDFSGDEFPDEKLRLLLSSKEYLTLNRTKLHTIKFNPERKHIIHGQHTEPFFLHAAILDQLQHGNGSNNENAKNVNVMKSNDVEEEEDNISSIIKRTKIISINASEWDTKVEKNETINVIRENNTVESISGTGKRIATMRQDRNIGNVTIPASVSNDSRIHGDNPRFNQENVRNETLMGVDQFLKPKPAQWGTLQLRNDTLITNGVSVIRTNVTSLEHDHIGMQKSDNYDSTSKWQMNTKIFNETLVETPKKAIEAGLIVEKASNDNSPNEITNSSAEWDANLNDSQVLRPTERREETEVSREALTVRSSTNSEQSDDDFYEELDEDFEVDDEDNAHDEDVEKYESENPYGTVVIVLPGDGEKIDLKSSSMKSEVVTYDKITNSLLYLLTNLTVTATINERNTKNILRQLSHQKEQLQLLKNQYEAVSNYLINMTDSKNK